MHIIALITNVVGLAVAIVWAATTRAYDAYLAVIALAGALPLALKNSVQQYVAVTLRTMKFPLEVALLGPPASGKTVYVTALLQALMQEHKRLEFIPRTPETLEQLMKSFRSFGAGQFLSRTPIGTSRPYLGSLIMRKSFGRTTASEISFHDHAGEAMFGIRRDTDKADLRDNEALAAAIKAQFVFVFVDLTRSDVYDYVELLHVLAEALPRTNDHRINKAIAVIFPKSDTLPTQAHRSELQDRAQPLLAACARLTRVHKVFFVSSTGPTDGEQLPNPRQPENLATPLEWCLSQTFE